MDADTREQVWDRAGGRCEYCLLHQDDDPLFTFHPTADRLPHEPYRQSDRTGEMS